MKIRVRHAGLGLAMLCVTAGHALGQLVYPPASDDPQAIFGSIGVGPEYSRTDYFPSGAGSFTAAATATNTGSGDVYGLSGTYSLTVANDSSSITGSLAVFGSIPPESPYTPVVDAHVRQIFTVDEPSLFLVRTVGSEEPDQPQEGAQFYLFNSVGNIVVYHVDNHDLTDRGTLNAGSNYTLIADARAIRGGSGLDSRLSYRLTVTAASGPNQWFGGGGTIGDVTRWTNAAPSGVDAVARFWAGTVGDTQVTVDAGNTVLGAISFDNAADHYTLAGPGGLTLQTSVGNAAVTVVNGSHTIDAPLSLASPTTFDIQPATSTLTVSHLQPSAQAITKTGAGSLLLNTAITPSLTIQGGDVKLTSAVAARMSALAIDTGATLDLGTDGLVYDYAGTSPIATLRSMITAGQIITSVPGQVIGYAEAGDLGLTSFMGQTGIDSTTALLRSTLPADSNLDGHVNFNDLVILAQNYSATSGKTWSNGDSNGDGAVNFSDLVLLAQHYNASAAAIQSLGGEAFATDWALAQAFVPEPMAVSSLAIAVLVGRRRRAQSA